MRQVELPAGTIEYDDTAGSGPVLVLLHGLVMDGSLWRHVVADLRRDFRCVLPTLPLGAHRLPMRADADLSPRGIGRILAEFLERLDLADVTLSFNDWSGAQVMIADGLMERVGRLVLISCEAFENYPPGVPGRMAALSAKGTGRNKVSQFVRTLAAARDHVARARNAEYATLFLPDYSVAVAQASVRQAQQVQHWLAGCTCQD